jgi:EpsI family protein
MSTARLFAAVVLLASVVAVTAGAREPTAGRGPTVAVPFALDTWSGVDVAALDEETQQALSADFVLNRAYVDTDGTEAGLYVAYYNQQRPGVSIHSPLHCLPGTGWDVVSSDIVALTFPGHTGNVRRLIAQKDAVRVMVLYWYWIDGRMIASELGSRMELLSSRVRRGRNDAALVRIALPVSGSDADAERRGVSFARALVPHLLRGAD